MVVVVLVMLAIIRDIYAWSNVSRDQDYMKEQQPGESINPKGHWSEQIREKMIDQSMVWECRRRFVHAQMKPMTKMRYGLDFDDTIDRLLSGQETIAIARAGTISERAFRKLYQEYFQPVFKDQPDIRTLRSMVNSYVAEQEKVPSPRKRALTEVVKQAGYHGATLMITELTSHSAKSALCELNGESALISLSSNSEENNKGNGQKYYRFEFSHRDVEEVDWVILVIQSEGQSSTYVVPTSYLKEHRVIKKDPERADYTRCSINIPLEKSVNAGVGHGLSVEQFKNQWPSSTS